VAGRARETSSNREGIVERNSGFTLVEMLLVLAIIGILVTIVLASVVGVTVETKEKKVRADIRLIQAALGQYYIKYNTFPGDAGDWIGALLAMRPRVFDERPGDPFQPTTDPKNPPPYQYQYEAPVDAGDIPTYAVWSIGASQQEDVDVTDSDTIEYTPECIFVSNASIRSTK
jgi:general secretion pathway protein G